MKNHQQNELDIQLLLRLLSGCVLIGKFPQSLPASLSPHLLNTSGHAYAATVASARSYPFILIHFLSSHPFSLPISYDFLHWSESDTHCTAALRSVWMACCHRMFAACPDHNVNGQARCNNGHGATEHACFPNFARRFLNVWSPFSVKLVELRPIKTPAVTLTCRPTGCGIFKTRGMLPVEKKWEKIQTLVQIAQLQLCSWPHCSISEAVMVSMFQWLFAVFDVLFLWFFQ